MISRLQPWAGGPMLCGATASSESGLIQLPNRLIVEISRFLALGDLALLAPCSAVLNRLLSLKLTDVAHLSPGFAFRRALPVTFTPDRLPAYGWRRLLACLDRLEHVHLACYEETPLGVLMHELLVTSATSLRHLSVQGWLPRQLAADVLTQCTGLQSLELRLGSGDQWFEQLQPLLLQLHTLRLPSALGASGLELRGILRACPQLTRLETRVQYLDRAALETLTRLQVVELSGDAQTWLPLAWLAPSSLHLRRLTLSGQSLSLSDAPLCFPLLESLRVGDIVHATKLCHVALPSLRRLRTGALCAAGLCALDAAAPHLEELDMAGDSLPAGRRLIALWKSSPAAGPHNGTADGAGDCLPFSRLHSFHYRGLSAAGLEHELYELRSARPTLIITQSFRVA